MADKIKEDELRLEAQKYGYCNLFATPEDPQKHIEQFKGAFVKKDHAHYYTAMGCLANYFAVELAKKDRKINKLKEVIDGLV